MPTRTKLDLKQLLLIPFPDEATMRLLPEQEKELDRALIDLLLSAPESKDKAGGDQ